MRLLPCGEQALLVELDDLDQVQTLARAVRAAVAAAGAEEVWASVQDVVPAAHTVLVVLNGPRRLPLLAGALARLDLAGVAAEPTRAEQVEIAVHYDGPDLAEAAGHCGLSVDELVAAHTGAHWQVAFCGFAPGFGYLVGNDPRLDVPRRPTPRTRVPVGAVGLAGRFTGAYPRESPGGWQLIGRTDAVLWEPARENPALLRPGVAVRFVVV